ncbi:right-handed parallel beta-helix repeat-containing protein [Flavicella sediminum]|uniref:right-handed parallel beta-helix repeat-containing protein n=1 Tax=Flavicella sediminum TaxID=2585141 RepID=UPI001FB81737|nr:right-handed parallel beta-helix repeat-containing protein [Flavicella sediminum]
MRNLYSILVIFCLIAFSISCRKDFSTIESTGNLTFSRDTIFLDTIFTNISSSTYALKVYNKSNKDIHIPSINLGRGDNSFYRLNVDGIPGKSFENTPLLAKDSLYVLIEATIDFDLLSDPIYKDSIVFHSGEKLQDVKLITTVKDAHFIYSDLTTAQLKKIRDTITDPVRKLAHFTSFETTDIYGDTVAKRVLTNSELHFTNAKSYSLYNYCIVPENKTLVIDAGAQLFFHDKAALIIEKNATIQINGTLDNKVTIEGNRLEFDFSETAGQWDGIWLKPESKENTIAHTRIKNAAVGIICDSISTSSAEPTLTIKNSEIYNTSVVGLLASESYIKAENLVIGNSRQGSLSITNGGSYEFNHCTFANYWSDGVRRFETVQISNNEFDLDEEDNPVYRAKDLTKANFTNCIITGNNSREIEFFKNETAVFSVLFENCLLKYNSSNEDPLYDFTDETLYPGILLNGEPNFRDTSSNDFIMGEESEAINKGKVENALRTPLDILGIDRTLAPDIGAYQHIIFETEEEIEE